jgi:uncharacterized protein (TIRG00374 family)
MRLLSARRLLGLAFALIVVAAVFVNVLPRIADYGDVLRTMERLSPAQIVLLLAVAVLNIATFAPPWMTSLPGLGFRQAIVLTQTSTALSSAVPGGDAVGIGVSYAMLREWRFERRSVTTAVLVTGVWNQLINVCLPLAALALLTAGGEQEPLLRTAGLAGAAALVVLVGAVAAVFWEDRAARGVGERAERVASWALCLLRDRPARGWGESFVAFRRETLALLRRRWHWITAASLAGHLSVFLVLLASIRCVGVSSGEVTTVEALAAWGLVRLVTAVPITPGGLGVVELGLTAGLIGFGGDDAEVVAGVLLYRALTYLPPIVLGLVLGLTWRRHRVETATSATSA